MHFLVTYYSSVRLMDSYTWQCVSGSSAALMGEPPAPLERPATASVHSAAERPRACSKIHLGLCHISHKKCEIALSYMGLWLSLSTGDKFVSQYLVENALLVYILIVYLLFSFLVVKCYVVVYYRNTFLWLSCVAHQSKYCCCHIVDVNTLHQVLCKLCLSLYDSVDTSQFFGSVQTCHSNLSKSLCQALPINQNPK